MIPRAAKTRRTAKTAKAEAKRKALVKEMAGYRYLLPLSPRTAEIIFRALLELGRLAESTCCRTFSSPESALRYCLQSEQDDV
jgi:hypothetical protein